MQPRQLRLDHASFRHRIANATAKRINHVFLRMSISREINPLPSSALPAIIAKRLMMPFSTRR
jgi:hypothetical protein